MQNTSNIAAMAVRVSAFFPISTWITVHFRLQIIFDARRLRATADVPPSSFQLAAMPPINTIF
jgi:hypothetical protein